MIKTGWWFQMFCILTPTLQKWSNLTSIFFKGVETTNWIWSYFSYMIMIKMYWYCSENTLFACWYRGSGFDMDCGAVTFEYIKIYRLEVQDHWKTSPLKLLSISILNQWSFQKGHSNNSWLGTLNIFFYQTTTTSWRRGVTHHPSGEPPQQVIIQYLGCDRWAPDPVIM